MPITRLHYPNSITPGQTIVLDTNASHHLIRVMRTRKDSDIILFNGDGFEYAATLLDENTRGCTVAVNTKTSTQRESPARIALIQGISRNDRMDACIQKSTELGVSVIVPVLCERSTTKLKDNRSEKKITHWQQVVISACEQSGRCVIPELQAITTYVQALQNTADGLKLVLDPDSTKQLSDIQKPEGTISVLVGPESGLTHNEIKLALEMDFIGVKLGPRVLRTETAGPACIAAIQTLWGDLGGVLN